MKSELNNVVTWGGGGSSADPMPETLRVGSTYVDYPYFEYHWYPYSSHYCVCSEDKTKQAFKIVKLLMKKKLAKVDKVKEFVELIDEILEIL